MKVNNDVKLLQRSILFVEYVRYHARISFQVFTEKKKRKNVVGPNMAILFTCFWECPSSLEIDIIAIQPFDDLNPLQPHRFDMCHGQKLL